MSRKRVEMSRDHLERQAKCHPLAAVEELVWNGLDAGGVRVDVQFELEELNSVKTITVRDWGSGIHPDRLAQTFGTVGSSVKLQDRTNSDGRLVHGKEGRGRFKALSLGKRATWNTIYSDNGQLYSYAIHVNRDDMDFFNPGNPIQVTTGSTGTTLVIEDVDEGQLLLTADKARQTLAEKLALYLRTYPNTSVYYDSRPIETSTVIEHSEDYELDVSKSDRKPAQLTVIEWKFKVDSKKLYLCDAQGFAWHEIKAGVQGRGVEYTAYLRSEEIQQWHQSGHLAQAELRPEINELIELAKNRLRQHVRERLASEAEELVTQWKRDDIYPYSEYESIDALKQAERDVFDIVATRVNEHHAPFRDGELEGKKLTLALIKQSLESNPSSLMTIFRDVIKLPAQEQDEFADLLRRTPLTFLIKAAKIVTERLDTIQAFEHLVFDEDWKAKLLERTQLHRLLVHQVWILGETYTLDNDDESLKEVLKKHIKHLEREDIAPEVDVKTIEGKEGIPDLMLSRRFKHAHDQFEHLVIELKRPSQSLGRTELGQLEVYAMTVAKDERFNTDRYRWTFVIIGNNLDDYATERASTDALAKGCIYEKGNVTIWVRTWADVLGEAKLRYEFFREKLQLEASSEMGMNYLMTHYPHLMTGRGVRKTKDLELTAKLQAET
ncbi:MAG: ATP-binding protein [Phycisphaerales bacterium]